jgi:hypothetical protein
MHRPSGRIDQLAGEQQRVGEVAAQVESCSTATTVRFSARQRWITAMRSARLGIDGGKRLVEQD